MSATGRTREGGLATVRQIDDDYETSAWCVRSIWPHVRPVSGLVLEPCAGRGAIVEALIGRADQTLAPSSDMGLWPMSLVHARELDEARCGRIPLGLAAKGSCDWLRHVETIRPQLVITNPPYKLALEFVAKSIALQQPHGGTTAMLLRLNFLGSQKRGQWLRDHLPDVYVLSKRPSFCTYVSENKDKNQGRRFEAGKWWSALIAVKVGVPEELVEIWDGSWDGTEITLAPSRVPAVKEWCARLPGWEAEPLKFRGGTDATEYAWFVWGPRNRGRIHILEERA